MLVVSLVLVAISLGGIGTAVAGATGVLQADAESSDNGEPPPHQDPDEINEDDTERLGPALESSLSEQLREATAGLDERTDAAARQSLNSTYDEQLSRYETVVGHGQAEPYREAGDHHRTFTESNQNIDELYAEYEQARQAGDEQQARTHLRELEAEAERLQESGDELIAAYAEIEDRTDEDHSEQIATIEARQDAVEALLDEATATELVETQLRIETNADESSFENPAEIEGQLTTADGEPIAEESITVAVDQQEYSVETGTDGTFSLSHRPVQSAVGETALTVQYLPDPDSVYRTTAESVAITVVQTDAAVDIETHSTTASLEETATAEGTVVAGEQSHPVAGKPVGLFVGETQIDTATTDADGEFSVSSTIPQSVPAGDSTLEIRTAGDDQAVGPASDAVPITVESMPTTLAVRSETTSDGSVTAVGSLETESGTPVEGEPVTFTAGGETVGTAETTQNGTFEQPLELTPTAEEAQTVEARFDGQSTNLDDATATTTVSITSQQADTSQIPISAGQLVVASGGTILLFGGVALWWVRRDETLTAEQAVSVGDPERSGRELSDELYSAATARLEGGEYDAATVLAYAAMRRRFADEYDIADSSTHWELYEAYTATELGHTDTLTTLTRQYEAVCFASEPTDATTAEMTVSAAEQLIAAIDTAAANTSESDVNSGSEASSNA